MTIIRLDSFKKDFKRLPLEIQERIEKQLRLLMSNPRHPSLHIKKMNDPRNIWEVRITQSYRLTFQVKKDTYILRRAGTHDILKSPQLRITLRG